MSENSAFWDNELVGDAASATGWEAPYLSREKVEILDLLLGNDDQGYVIPERGFDLKIEAEDPVSMNINILSGNAFVKGRLYENTTTASLTIGANASGSPRIDRIILRTSFAAQTIRLAILQGTPGATPALPTLTQDANTWEVSLAYIWVANGAATIPNEEIHDERVFLKTSLSHKYEAGSQNLIKNSEFMGFSELSGGATTNPPDLWDLVSTPSDIASATKYSGMPRGRAIQITSNAASEGISQTIVIGTAKPHSLKIPINVTAGDVGVVEIVQYSELAEYATSNQNSDVALRGPSGAGAETDINTSDIDTCPVGKYDTANTYREAQSFQVTAGRLSTIKVTWEANVGSPVGTVTWGVRSTNEDGTVLATGTFTPTPSGEDIITVVDGPFLASATTYYLRIESTQAQSNSNAWIWKGQLGSSYADGGRTYSNNGGAWTATCGDMECSITTTAVSLLDKLSQSFQVSITAYCSSAKLWLKKVGAPAGTMTLRIETNNAGIPSGNLVNASATATIAENTLTTSYTQIEFIFAGTFSLSASTTYWLVLSTDRVASATNYVLWGADNSPTYASGEMKSETGAVWSAESKDACFLVIFSSQLIKYIRRTGYFIEELLYFTSNSIPTEYTIKLLCLNNGDIIQFGQCLLLEGRHPGPFREIHETILFKDGITDSNWAADAKSDGTTTIDLDSDFQALVLPGTRQILISLMAKDTTTDGLMTSYASSNQDTGVELQGAAGIDKIAQSFQVSAGSVTRVKLYLKKTGSPTGNYLASIETNNAGSPSGTWVTPDAFSNYIVESYLPTGYTWVIYTLNAPVPLSGATTYWLVLWTDRASSGANFITWGADSSAPSYASGEMKSENGAVWSAESKDGCFEVWFAGTTITSSLSARIKSSSTDAVIVSLKSVEPTIEYYSQGWVRLNLDNQFDLYVVDTTGGSIVCTAKIIGIET